ncbi:MAG: dTMP kinase, partial [Nitrososphaerales archaeon]|nr:dTMP kinase [Nitrososphaerales archaeon]
MNRFGKGIAIAIEGLDKSGKKTQSEILMKRLKDEGFQVELISFPDYSTPIGREIRASLTEERIYSIRVRHLLLATNRWERYEDIKGWLQEGKVVILNRYSQSNLAYGLANGLSLSWLINLERGLPKAKLVIVIDISPQTSLLRSKFDRDVHERDLNFLARVRENYLNLAKRYSWKVIDGERSINDVAEDIWRIVHQYITDQKFKIYA